MGLSCGMKCLKYMLFTFNFILFLIGLALLAVGIFVAVDANKLFEWLQKVDFSAEVGSFDVKNMLKNCAYVLIAFGAFVFLVAFLGCCGAIKESKCMLGTYATIVCICLVVEIAAVALAAIFWDHTKKEVRAYLNATIAEDYDGFNGKTMPTGKASIAWDMIMIHFKCCGIDNYEDFQSIGEKWNKTLPDGKTAKIPAACCIMDDSEKFPNVTIKDYPACPTAPTTANAYYGQKDGCYSKVMLLISKYAVPIIGVGAAVAFLQIFVIIAGCCLCRRIGEED